jgi:hypothetical protein
MNFRLGELGENPTVFGMEIRDLNEQEPYLGWRPLELLMED